jgi:succinate-acetate transporter protein
MTHAASAPDTLPREVLLRPVATPLPLGLLGLVVATSTYGALQLGWVPVTESSTAGLATLLFAVPLQLLAAVIGFWARDPVAGTGLALQAGLWGVTAATTLTSPPGTTDRLLGVALLSIAASLLVPAVAGVAKYVASAVFFTTALRTTLLAVYELTAVSAWRIAAGAVGLFLGVLALYAALGFEVEGGRGRQVLPLGRPGPVTQDGEPGVRSRL